MALITCPKCGRNISDKANKCPGCGWIPGSKREVVTLNEKEPIVIDKTDYETIKKLQIENEALRKRNQKLQEENTELISNNENQIFSDNSEKPNNIIVKRKDLILGLVGILIIAAVALCMDGFITKNIAQKEFQNFASMPDVEVAEEQPVNEAEIEENKPDDGQEDVANETEQPKENDVSNKEPIEVTTFEPKTDGYNQGDVIYEMNGVSVIYESCEITDETTDFSFKCINNGTETYKVYAENIAINRVMMEKYFWTDNITAGNQGKLEFYYGNEFLAEECGDFQEMNLTITIRDENYKVIGSMDNIYLYP